MGQIYQGDIPDVMAAGEYDQGDQVLIYYDDLYDLIHPRQNQLCPCCNYPECGHKHNTGFSGTSEPDWGTTQDGSVTWKDSGPILSPKSRSLAHATAYGIWVFLWGILVTIVVSADSIPYAKGVLAASFIAAITATFGVLHGLKSPEEK